MGAITLEQEVAKFINLRDRVDVFDPAGRLLGTFSPSRKSIYDGLELPFDEEGEKRRIAEAMAGLCYTTVEALTHLNGLGATVILGIVWIWPAQSEEEVMSSIMLDRDFEKFAGVDQRVQILHPDGHVLGYFTPEPVQAAQAYSEIPELSQEARLRAEADIREGRTHTTAQVLEHLSRLGNR